jgi:thioredoxin
MIIDITDTIKLNNYINKDKVILYFTAKWCGPCRNISPVYMQLSTQYKNVSFCKLDVDAEDNKTIMDKLNIESLPTFVFFHKGSEVDRFTGSNSEMLKNKINQLFL